MYLVHTVYSAELDEILTLIVRVDIRRKTRPKIYAAGSLIDSLSYNGASTTAGSYITGGSQPYQLQCLSLGSYHNNKGSHSYCCYAHGKLSVAEVYGIILAVYVNIPMFLHFTKRRKRRER